MLSRILSMNPIGIVLLLLGVGVMLCGKVVPEKGRVAAKVAALALAVSGAVLVFI